MPQSFSKSFGDTVTVILTTFAALAGVALERFLNESKLALTPDFAAHPALFYCCFAGLISLALRFLIGSDSHFKDTYVPERAAPTVEMTARQVFCLIKDVCFLVFFGVVLVIAAKAEDFHEFAHWLIVFLLGGSGWAALDMLVRWKAQWAAKKYDVLWLFLDVIQAGITYLLACYYQPDGNHLAIPFLLAGFYLGFFAVDLAVIVRLQKPKPSIP